MRVFLPAAAISFFLCSSVLAQDAGPPLDEERINSFIASMVQLEEWGEAHQDDVNALEDVFDDEVMGDVRNPFGAATKIIESQSWAGEVVEIVRNHGFAGLEDWARTGNRIFMAFMAVQMDLNRPEMQAGLAEALKQIENSDMSEEQKTKMREMLRGANDMAGAYATVPEVDKKAVAPFLEALENMGNAPASDR